jgi:hypothetical protein
MQREAWQSMPIGYESESNQTVVTSVIAPDSAVRVKVAVGVSSLRRWKRKSSLSCLRRR